MEILAKENIMIVYVVYYDSIYADRWERMFLKEKSAEEYCAKLNKESSRNNYCIEEVEVDES